MQLFKSVVLAVLAFVAVVAATEGECKPLLQSCDVNSDCCADLCVLGVSLPLPVTVATTLMEMFSFALEHLATSINVYWKKNCTCSVYLFDAFCLHAAWLTIIYIAQFGEGAEIRIVKLNICLFILHHVLFHVYLDVVEKEDSFWPSLLG